MSSVSHSGSTLNFRAKTQGTQESEARKMARQKKGDRKWSQGYNKSEEGWIRAKGEEYRSAVANGDDESQERIIDEVTQFVLSKPTPELVMADWAIDEVIRKLAKKSLTWNGNTLEGYSSYATDVCKHFYRNFYDAKQNGRPSTREKFSDRRMIKQSFIMNARRKTNPVTIHGLRSSMEAVHGNAPSIFLPVRAKSLYERYAPEGGTIYDYSIGWGSRMLGALSSDKNFTYIGVDPDGVMFANACALRDRIERVLGKVGAARLHRVGSEKFTEHEGFKPESVDFAFSSPPYFDLEVYSQDPGQSVQRFPDYDDWLNFYVRGTLRGCREILKPRGLLGINVADNKKLKLEGDWRRIAQEEGFKEIEVVRLQKLSRPGRSGAGSKDPRNKMIKGEPVFIYEKA